ncbi:MAG: YjbE family putative metal transport protein, partial [Arenicellales bacterium WSBS_2016_MAG_OTU3]
DNAIVVGLAAAGLAADQRRKAILFGIAVATIMRIGFALVTVQLLQIVGLILVGGLLLLWVCWKMWHELREQMAVDDVNHEHVPRKTFAQAIMQIVIADVSMSLDNVLAVAGAAHGHPTWILIFGLVLSVAFMGAAASLIARILQNHAWIAYAGLLVILYVALSMVWEGSHQILEYYANT